MNASVCFSNAKKFLLEIRRLEQVKNENENENKCKNEIKNESKNKNGNKIENKSNLMNEKIGGLRTFYSGKNLADKQASEATVALLKVWNLIFMNLWISFLLFRFDLI